MSTSTSTEHDPVTEQDLKEVRGLIELALQFFNDHASPSALMAAGVTAEDLAEDVRKWTHTTRLRDFVEGVRKAAV